MSISTASQIIAVRAPQFSGDPRLSDLINLAKLQTSSKLGDKYQLALALRVMHWLILEERGGGNPGSGGGTSSGSSTPGNLKSEKEGDLSRNYELTSILQRKWGDLTSTQYGLELVSLIKGHFFLPRTRRYDPSTES